MSERITRDSGTDRTNVRGGNEAVKTVTVKDLPQVPRTPAPGAPRPDGPDAKRSR
jgi:hypothetical protein